MEKEVNNFLKAEELANEFVETLKELYEEIKNYQSTSQTLENVREHILNLINRLEALANNLMEIIHILKNFEGNEIINKLETIERSMNDLFLNLTNELKELKTEFKQSVTFLDNISQKITTELERMSESFKKTTLEIVNTAKDTILSEIEQSRKEMHNLIETNKLVLENRLSSIETELERASESIKKTTSEIVNTAQGKILSEIEGIIKKDITLLTDEIGNLKKWGIFTFIGLIVIIVLLVIAVLK